MNTSRRFFVDPKKDKNVFQKFSKKLGVYAAAAASLPNDFPPMSRHAVEFGAKCFGSTSYQRLFAESGTSTQIIASNFTRQDVARQLEAGIKRGAQILAADHTIDVQQAEAIADAAPSIVKAVAKDLQYFAVDHFTLERQVIDRILLEARAPKFEYAITRDRRHVFVFELARDALRELAGHDAQSLDKITPAQTQVILRNSVIPLSKAMMQGCVPLNHVPVVLSDEGGNVVGVTFQHPVHQGVVAVCCNDVERFWAVSGALHSGEMAMSMAGSNWHFGYEDPSSFRPYFPTRRFPSMFNASEDDRGPVVYFSQVSVEKAIAYLSELDKAINGERVKSTESDRKVLKGASLSSRDIIGAKSGKRRTFWGLQSFQSQPGQSKIMSASGTANGIVVGGEWADQWYLRQIYWLDESDLFELGMPSDHFLMQRADVDVTRVIPDDVEDFTCSALEHINKMPLAGQREDAIRVAEKKLHEQKKLLRKIKDCIEETVHTRSAARLAGMTAVGPDVLTITN